MSVDTPAPPTAGSCCLGCGTHVSADYVRVFGDADGNLYRCLHCDSRRGVSEGRGAGLERTNGGEDPELRAGGWDE